MLTLVCRTQVSKPLPFAPPVRSKVLVKFGEKVREKRTELDLSQEELAERAGVHRTYVGMIERAEKNITLENIEKFAKALTLPVEKLCSIWCDRHRICQCGTLVNQLKNFRMIFVKRQNFSRHLKLKAWIFIFEYFCSLKHHRIPSNFLHFWMDTKKVNKTPELYCQKMCDTTLAVYHKKQPNVSIVCGKIVIFANVKPLFVALLFELDPQYPGYSVHFVIEQFFRHALPAGQQCCHQRFFATFTAQINERDVFNLDVRC